MTPKEDSVALYTNEVRERLVQRATRLLWERRDHPPPTSVAWMVAMEAGFDAADHMAAVRDIAEAVKQTLRRGELLGMNPRQRRRAEQEDKKTARNTRRKHALEGGFQ